MQLNNIGSWKVFALETGMFSLDGGAMMGSVPKVLWSKVNPPDELNRIKLAMRCMLLDDGENIILVETGMGNKVSDKFKDMFNIDQSQNPLSDTLGKYGYIPESITHILLTHLHFDHAGGAVKRLSNGDFSPTFPNAKYYISKENWEAGLNPSPRDKASYLKENYEVLKKEGVLEIIPSNSEIINGVSTYVVNGHTYGQQLIKISDEGKTVIFCSDLVPLKSHLKLPWIMGYDLNAVLTLEEKQKFFKLASDNKWILFFYHDPETVAVTIKEKNGKIEILDEVRRK